MYSKPGSKSVFASTPLSMSTMWVRPSAPVSQVVYASVDPSGEIAGSLMAIGETTIGCSPVPSAFTR